MEKKYLISWSSKNDVEKSIYFPETEKDAEEYLANLISNNAKDVILWEQVPYDVAVKLSKKSDKP